MCKRREATDSAASTRTLLFTSCIWPLLPATEPRHGMAAARNIHLLTGCKLKHVSAVVLGRLFRSCTVCTFLEVECCHFAIAEPGATAA